MGRIFLAAMLAPLPACSPSKQDGTEAFCERAGDLLTDDRMGDDPAQEMLTQMLNVLAAGASLPQEELERLEARLSEIIEELEAVVRGEDRGGWSTESAVEYVADLCNRDDLIPWVVQF